MMYSMSRNCSSSSHLVNCIDYREKKKKDLMQSMELIFTCYIFVCVCLFLVSVYLPLSPLASFSLVMRPYVGNFSLSLNNIGDLWLRISKHTRGVRDEISQLNKSFFLTCIMIIDIWECSQMERT